MIRGLKIGLLKHRLRRHYNAYRYSVDRMSCGARLAVYISPHAAHHALKCNKLLDRLAELDPTTPKSRLMLE